LERSIDHGSILFFGSGVLTDWNTLTQTNAVLMFDRIFRAMLERTLPRRNLDSVEQIFLPLDAAQRGNRFLLLRPDPLMDGLLGTARDLADAEPLAVESIGNDQSGITARNIAQRGIYQLLSLPPESGEIPAQTAPLWEIPFAVNGPATESELLPLNEEEISARLAGVTYRWIPRDEPLSLDGARLRGQNLWKWLMALALLTLLLEMLLLAWPALRRERAA
jgi:hypothetical protein